MLFSKYKERVIIGFNVNIFNYLKFIFGIVCEIEIKNNKGFKLKGTYLSLMRSI